MTGLFEWNAIFFMLTIALQLKPQQLSASVLALNISPLY